MEISTFNKAKENMTEVRLSETYTRGEAKCNVYDCYFTSKRTKEDYYIEVQTSELNGMNWVNIKNCMNETDCISITKTQAKNLIKTLSKQVNQMTVVETLKRCDSLNEKLSNSISELEDMETELNRIRLELNAV